MYFFDSKNHNMNPMIDFTQQDNRIATFRWMIHTMGMNKASEYFLLNIIHFKSANAKAKRALWDEFNLAMDMNLYRM